MKKLGVCGLDCSSCEAFIATERNDDELRKKIAVEWYEKYRKKYGGPSIKPEEINCRGCVSDGPLYSHCHICEIRKCGLEKGVSNCGECAEYRCEKIVKRQETMPGAKENCDEIKSAKTKH